MGSMIYGNKKEGKITFENRDKEMNHEERSMSPLLGYKERERACF